MVERGNLLMGETSEQRWLQCMVRNAMRTINQKREASGYMMINASIQDVLEQGRDLRKFQGHALVVIKGRNVLC
jgi:hypothetical protein